MAITELISEAVTVTVIKNRASILYSAFYFVQITHFLHQKQERHISLAPNKSNEADFTY
jgi:hypothetical protein